MTRPLYETNQERVAANHGWAVRQLQRRPAISATGGGGNFIYAIKVFEDDVTVATGDGAFKWAVPEDLDGSLLVGVESYVTTVSSSGSVTVMVRNVTDAVDMLSTALSIDPNEKNSKTAATPAVINTTYDDVAWGDELSIDVDSAGTGAAGLGVNLFFAPADTATVTLTGAKGDPGGVNAWTGAWATSTSYTTGDAVSNNGSSYVAIQGHTSGASSEPGVGASWESYWMLLAEVQADAALEISIAQGGVVLTTGVKGYLEVPFACSIVSARMFADTTGSAVIDIWKDTYANYPPTDADSITASAPPTISSATKSQDTTLSGWTTSLSKGDVLAFNVDSCSSITRLTLSLGVTRT